MVKQHVSGYTRKDGTRVKGYYRDVPIRDNYFVPSIPPPVTFRHYMAMIGVWSEHNKKKKKKYYALTYSDSGESLENELLEKIYENMIENDAYLGADVDFTQDSRGYEVTEIFDFENIKSKNTYPNIEVGYE